MARHRKTDPREALMRAMTLFWEMGYDRTGTREIEERTGITRFTLQTTYGGKMGLFLQAIDLYLDLFEQTAALPCQVAGLEELAAWFESDAPPPAKLADAARNGCLFLNTLIEFGDTSDAINDRRQRYYELIGGRFETVLSNLKQAGRLPAGFDASDGAEILKSSAISMAVLIRAANSMEAARPVAEATARMVRSWGTSIEPPDA